MLRQLNKIEQKPLARGNQVEPTDAKWNMLERGILNLFTYTTYNRWANEHSG